MMHSYAGIDFDLIFCETCPRWTLKCSCMESGWSFPSVLPRQPCRGWPTQRGRRLQQGVPTNIHFLINCTSTCVCYCLNHANKITLSPGPISTLLHYWPRSYLFSQREGLRNELIMKQHAQFKLQRSTST